MKVEVWSDVVCPWCYLGKRRLEHAVERVGNGPVEVVWRAFQLDPDAPRHGEPGAGRPVAERLAERGYPPEQLRRSQARLTEMAAAEGLEYHLEDSVTANSLDAHRLVKAASSPEQADELVERLFRAYHSEGRRIDDPEVLAEIGRAAGLPDARSAQTEENARAVAADVEESRQLGVQGVPFFVFGRRLAVSGAQPVELFERALVQAAG